MTPLDIVKVLTAAAPIAASVASIANNDRTENKERKETSSVTNISITINNTFYSKPDRESVDYANQMQNKLISDLMSGERYKL